MKKIKKIVISLLVLFVFTGCSGGKDSDDSELIEEEVVFDYTDYNPWSIEPKYDYADIDLDFNGHNYNVVEEVYYNANSPYEDFAEGGFIAIRNNRFGLVDDSGTLKTDIKYILYWVTGNRYMFGSDKVAVNVEMEDDMRSEFIYDNYRVVDANMGFHAVGGTGVYNEISEKGEPLVVHYISDDESESELYDFDEAVFNGYVNEEDIAVFISDYKYVVVYKDGYKYLPKADGCWLIDVSENIMAFCTDKVMTNDHSHRQFEVVNRRKYRSDVFYVDKEGKTIASGYDDGYGFYEGYAAVKKNGKWGYINKNGEVVVDFVFDKATPMFKGEAWVIYHGKTGKIQLSDMIEKNIPFTDDVLGVDEPTTKRVVIPLQSETISLEIPTDWVVKQKIEHGIGDYNFKTTYIMDGNKAAITFDPYVSTFPPIDFGRDRYFEFGDYLVWLNQYNSGGIKGYINTIFFFDEDHDPDSLFQIMGTVQYVETLPKIEITADKIYLRKGPSKEYERFEDVFALKDNVYGYTDVAEADGLKWYEISDGVWVADDHGQWVRYLGY